VSRAAGLGDLLATKLKVISDRGELRVPEMVRYLSRYS
jgi:hypothetical protein